MHQRNEAELIEKYFQYLFTEYGFSISEMKYFEDFSNWLVVLTAAECRLLFMEDRGSVLLSVGPPWNPSNWEAGRWFGLGIVIAYLNDGVFPWYYWDQMGPAEPQMEKLSGILRPYMTQICTLFSPKAYAEHETELNQLVKKRDDYFKPGRHS